MRNSGYTIQVIDQNSHKQRIKAVFFLHKRLYVLESVEDQYPEYLKCCEAFQPASLHCMFPLREEF